MGRGSGHAQGNGRGMSGKRPGTRLSRAGRREEWTRGIVNPAVWRASTILFDSVAEMEAASPPRHGTLHYGRNGTPTIWALCEALTELEPGAEGTRLYPSGSAAVASALLSVLRAGDELLMVDSAYGPTRALCDTLLARFGVETRYYDPLVGAGIEEMFTEKTRAVFMESPGSLTFEVQDVPAICAAAKAHGIVTLLDNTWATPFFFPAIAAGVDLSVLACTKFIGGHSDVMLGSVTTTRSHLKRLDQAGRVLGQTAGPDDAWLGLRGMRTLEIRLKRHEESGLKVARWLAEQPGVARILHPALPDCPGHEAWTRDFAGAPGVFSFALRGGDAAARARLIDGLELFGIGYSWGGFESLAVPADPVRTVTTQHWDGPLVRLHIGLEDPDDLIADLALGLDRFGADR
jgi:cysteine-S-conjugate beta-lyase